MDEAARLEAGGQGGDWTVAEKKKLRPELERSHGEERRDRLEGELGRDCMWGLCAVPGKREKTGSNSRTTYAQSQQTWVQTQALLLTGYVTSGKSLNLSELFFSHSTPLVPLSLILKVSRPRKGAGKGFTLFLGP